MESIPDKHFNNVLNSLVHNDILQKLISEIVESLDRNIESLKDSQEYLFSQIKSEDDLRGNYISQIINGENMCRVRKPFFSANNSLIPFVNIIEKQRINDGSHDYYLLKHQMHKLCSEKQFEVLKMAVGKNVYDIEHAELIKSKDKNSLKKLKKLKLLSIRELISRCDSEMTNRIDWMTISSQDLKGTIAHNDCRRLWEKVFNPEYIYTKWSESESKTLLQLTSEIGCQGKWVEIASRMPTKRQPFICYKKWLELTSKMETSEEWNFEEDEQLRQVIAKEMLSCNKIINWNKVALVIPNRSARDCEKRWNSLLVPINTRLFSDNDDYQLLLLIKKIGTENWADVAREMDQRTSDQCQLRYCDIVEELHPWSYFEDRRLWLVLRSYFRSLWCENNQVMEITMNLTIYKSVMQNFNGRCPLVLRHRYGKLCKWFHLWNQFYLSFNDKELKTTSLLSDSCEEKTCVINKILKIILRTSFFDRIRNALYLTGSKNPDSEANELIIQCKNGNSVLLNKLIKDSNNKKLMELLMFIIDLQNGIFIPTKFENYINKSCVGFKYPEKVDNNLRVLSADVRTFESKTAVSATLHKSLNEMIKDVTVTDKDKKCIAKLIECEGKFSSALNFAAETLAKTHRFKFFWKVFLLEEFLPQIIRLMIRYVYCQEHSEISSKNLTINYKNSLSNEIEQITELLIYRETIPFIYKTYLSSDKKKRCLSTMYLPPLLSINLMKIDKLEQCNKKSKKILKSQQNYPLADNEAFIMSSDGNTIRDLPLLPPNKCSINLLRAFILQKQSLKERGEKTFIEMVRLRYDNPAKYLESNIRGETPIVMDKSSLLLCNPKYTLLRSRLLSILSFPSVIARISPSECALIGDKLHEEQNKVFNSTKISDSFGNTNLLNLNFPTSNVKNSCTRRKRRISECENSDLLYLTTRNNHSMKISQSQSLTRSVGYKWVSLVAPECGRTFFISRDIFQCFLKNNFIVESINGVKSDDFLH